MPAGSLSDTCNDAVFCEIKQEIIYSDQSSLANLNKNEYLPATLEQADPIPWKARATNNTAYVSPNAKTAKKTDYLFSFYFIIHNKDTLSGVTALSEPFASLLKRSLLRLGTSFSLLG